MAEVTDRVQEERDLALQPRPLVRSVALAGWVIVLGFIKYGIGPWPSLGGMLELARSWSEEGRLPAEASYVGYSPLQSILLGTLGWSDLTRYILGSMLLLMVAVGLPLLMPRVRRAPQTQGLVLIVLAGGAVLPTLNFWIGGYDTPFVIAATVAALATRSWIRLAGWAVLAFQHHQMAIISLAAWVVLQVVHERSQGQPIPIRRIGSVVVAVLVGTVAIFLLAAQWKLADSRLDYVDSVGGFAAIALQYWPLAWLTTFSCLGIGWLLCIDERMRSDTVTRAFALSALAISVIVPQLALDHVRVSALALLLPTFTWILMLQERVPSDVLGAVIRRYTPIAVVLPIVLVWGGAAYFPGWTILRAAG